MNNLTKILAVFCVILIIGVSCTENSDSKKEIVYISSDITSPTTWSANNIYIIEKSNLYITSELNIEAGCVIKFSRYSGATLGNNGKIIAQGTVTKPIYFTSINDDNHGNDDNNNGKHTIPAAGDWGRINFNGSVNSSFAYCTFMYGGFDAQSPSTIDLSNGAQADFDNCTFAYNVGGEYNNFYIGALDASNASKNTLITNSTFYSNNTPISINANISIDNSNSFSNSTLSNIHNGIYVYGDNIKDNTSWLEDEVAFVITSDNLTVLQGKSLTLNDNVVLKFTEHSILTIVSGESYLVKHDADGVFFTSYKDDNLKGDTNADGENTIAQTGDWTGIYLAGWRVAGYADWDNILYNDPTSITK